MCEHNYEYNANLSWIHILAAIGILFFAMGQVLMPLTSIFTDREPYIAAMIVWACIGLLVTALFAWLLYGSLKKRIIINREKIVVVTPSRSREIAWKDIADVIHMTNKVNGITTMKQYEFKNYAGKTVFRMPENGRTRFSGDGDIVEVLFRMFEQRNQGPKPDAAIPENTVFRGQVYFPGHETLNSLPDGTLPAHLNTQDHSSIPSLTNNTATGIASDQITRLQPAAPAHDRERYLRDAVFQCSPAIKITGLLLLAVLVWLPAAGSVTASLQTKGHTDGAAILLGLAVVLLLSYLAVVNITSRIEFTASQIKYSSLFTRVKTIYIDSISNVLDQNSYGFRSIILYLYNGYEIRLRGIRLHKISDLTQMISMRIQRERESTSTSGPISEPIAETVSDSGARAGAVLTRYP